MPRTQSTRSLSAFLIENFSLLSELFRPPIDGVTLVLHLTRSPTYFDSSARSTAICLSTIARLVPPIACLRSTLASKSNTA